MNRQQRISPILETLEHMRKRPGMYFSSVSQADMYLRGFRSAGKLCLNLPPDTRYRATITIERGWTWSSRDPWDEMRKKGMDEAAIVDEMLIIEIAVWNRAYANLDNEIKSDEE